MVALTDSSKSSRCRVGLLISLSLVVAGSLAVANSSQIWGITQSQQLVLLTIAGTVVALAMARHVYQKYNDYTSFVKSTLSGLVPIGVLASFSWIMDSGAFSSYITLLWRITGMLAASLLVSHAAFGIVMSLPAKRVPLRLAATRQQLENH